MAARRRADRRDAVCCGGAALQTVSDQPAVYAADVDSIIHPVSAEYMIETMVRADRDGAALVVFTLRTPGGLVESTRDIITHMLAAKTPVVIFIAPSGARAASAGFLLTIAADVAAMAPGTHIGAAHPVSGDGEKMDETMAKKAAADVAAYARTLATRRHRNVSLAEEAGEHQSGVHRRGGVARHAATHRPRGIGPPGSAATARRSNSRCASTARQSC
jgi:membrane-bound serine protease (ClpP class)